jgi:hypothetical protein
LKSVVLVEQEMEHESKKRKITYDDDVPLDSKKIDEIVEQAPEV